ncbi:MAG: dehydrogenase subunit [Chthonomonadaceae bacterium]|nr:dehydrogenase subunit [Chthonomonadaceae bacterium]
MLSLAWLIVWLPLLGFAHNAFAGFLYKDPKAAKNAVSFVAPFVVFASFLVALILLPAVLGSPEHRAYAALLPFSSPDTPWIKFGGFQSNFALLLDPLSLLMTLIVTGVGGLIHIYATSYMADDKEFNRFFTYFNLFIFMMLLLVLGENFLLMFVGWEGVGTCSYLLISFWFTDVANAKAGNKAFIVNRVGDLGFALGMMAVWSVFGTLSFFNAHGTGVMQLAALHHDVLGHDLGSLQLWFAPALTTICVLLFIGAAGKSAQIPLFVWLPDAMAGPTPVSALIHAATMVTAGVVMLTRCSWLFVQSTTAMQIVAWIGLATAVLGATVALVQTDIKKVLAYSTISQLGYMFLACGVGNFRAAMFHVTTHAFFKALLFLGAGAVIHSMNGEQDMNKMGGLKALLPKTWPLMFIGTYAIAGIIPLAGFWSKDAILESAFMSPWGSGPILYLIGLGTAGLTAFYMNRMMWKTFYTDKRFEDGKLPNLNHSNEEHHDEPAAGHVHESPPTMLLPLYVLAFFSVIGGVFGFLFASDDLWKYTVAPLELGGLNESASLPGGAFVGYLLSSIVAIAGLAAAATVYKQRVQLGELLDPALKPHNPIYRILVAQWGFDALYDAVFVRFGGYVARSILWRTVDAGIDGTVMGMAKLVGGISHVGRLVQTGYVRNYALGMLVGVVVIVLGLLATWQSLITR